MATRRETMHGGNSKQACKPALRAIVLPAPVRHEHGKAHHVSVFDRKKARSYKNNTQDVACLNYFNRIQLDGMDPDALEAALRKIPVS
ncbi:MULTISPECIES: hypothetical protein [unclassified Bradyrhizobium]|uniref:hypothetical protein n=1 Tax=unclassified Bradyrhizobium TaxID=2631580 RepID=UPI000480079C|nr:MULTISPECIES: hypothetical protein [unclassified Bradyrhizobium]MDH2356888.1 hypothetical protein [Bradyrhizobium sp. SSUT112]